MGAALSDGTIWAWGFNREGQLGDGTTEQRITPVPGTGLTNVAAVAAGGYHGMALRSDRDRRAWGSNAAGLLGDGTTEQRITPVPVSGLTNVAAVAAGNFHSLAVGRAAEPDTGHRELHDQPPRRDATVTTDVELDGATATDPVETTLTTPVAGTVSVAETASQLRTGDFSVTGRLVRSWHRRPPPPTHL